VSVVKTTKITNFNNTIDFHPSVREVWSGRNTQPAVESARGRVIAGVSNRSFARRLTRKRVTRAESTPRRVAWELPADPNDAVDVAERKG